MKKIGIVSYNIHCNFTNYGSALQSWALNETLKKIGYNPYLVDYCPDSLKNVNPLNPFKNMWDKNKDYIRLCKLSLPSIRVNYKKFTRFYNTKFQKTKPYTPLNFNRIDECNKFICGSDTIFNFLQWGIDDGYFANYKIMKNNSIAYAASFGDAKISKNTKQIFKKLKNFKSIGLREGTYIPLLKSKLNIPLKEVLDPTLLLNETDYNKLACKKIVRCKYLLYYSRRQNNKMELFAEKMAKKNGLKIIDISLKATNSEKGHIMKYDAGIEEFLSLIKYSSIIVTNSYHAIIFALIYSKPFYVFTRELCDTKISNLLNLLDLNDRLMQNDRLIRHKKINFKAIHDKISYHRQNSIAFLKKSLSLIY